MSVSSKRSMMSNQGKKYNEQAKWGSTYCIPYFLVYKLTPVFQTKNNDIFESLCISQPPWLMIQNKTK